jgi:hypothetical protein
MSEELVGQAQEPFNKIVGNFPVGASLPGGGPKKPDPIAVRRGAIFCWAPRQFRCAPNPTRRRR